jgi:hypothetical protein
MSFQVLSATNVKTTVFRATALVIECKYIQKRTKDQGVMSDTVNCNQQT